MGEQQTEQQTGHGHQTRAEPPLHGPGRGLHDQIPAGERKPCPRCREQHVHEVGQLSVAHVVTRTLPQGPLRCPICAWERSVWKTTQG